MEVLVRDIPVYYEEYGTGTPMLMLHGWPVDHRQMASIMEYLFHDRSGWRRIYPDLPGMGKTPAPDWITTQDQMLEVVTEFMQIVAPVQRFVVVGGSYGGYLARGLVFQQGSQIDGVLLSIPVVETDLTKTQYPPHQILVEDAGFLAALTPEEKSLIGMVVVQSLEVLEWIRANMNPAIFIANHTFLARLSEHYAFSFPVDQLPTPFPAPTLLVAGRQDSMVGYREALKIIENYPRGTLAVLDRAGHGAPIEQKGLYDALVNEWLNRVEEYISNRH